MTSFSTWFFGQWLRGRRYRQERARPVLNAQSAHWPLTIDTRHISFVFGFVARQFWFRLPPGHGILPKVHWGRPFRSPPVGGSLHYRHSPLSILRLRLDTRDTHCRHSRCTGQQWRYGRFPPVRHHPAHSRFPLSKLADSLNAYPHIHFVLTLKCEDYSPFPTRRVGTGGAGGGSARGGWPLSLKLAERTTSARAR